GAIRVLAWNVPRLTGGNAMRFKRYLLALLLAHALAAEGGAPARPMLARSELPIEVLRDCAATALDGAALCADANLRIRWINRTPRGQLFLVERAACDTDGCRSWLIAKDDLGMTRIVLDVDGAVRFEPGAASFPVVHVRTEVGEKAARYARFEWKGDRYVRTDT